MVNKFVLNNAHFFLTFNAPCSTSCFFRLLHFLELFLHLLQAARI
jgi:hypothetical protein